MSSSLDAGNSAKQADEIRESKCPKSEDKKHEWVKHGTYPSTWYACKHCETSIYDKWRLCRFQNRTTLHPPGLKLCGFHIYD